MLLGPALKSMLGVGLLVTVIHYWPALFERYFTESWDFLSDFFIWRRSHE